MDGEAQDNLREWQRIPVTSEEHREAEERGEDWGMLRATSIDLHKGPGQVIDMINADYQSQLIDALNKLPVGKIDEALGLVEPTKLGVLWQLLEERKAD